MLDAILTFSISSLSFRRGILGFIIQRIDEVLEVFERILTTTPFQNSSASEYQEEQATLLHLSRKY